MFKNNGYDLIAGFILLANSSAVLSAFLLQSISMSQYLFWGFLLAAVFFLLIDRNRIFQTIRAGNLSFIVLINLITGLNWIAYVYALKYLEPAVVTAIICGIGPITIIAYQFLKDRKPVALPMVLSVSGALAGTFTLAGASMAGQSGIGQSSPLILASGLFACIFAGTMQAATILVLKNMGRHNMTSVQIMAHRFYFVILFAFVWNYFSSDPLVSSVQDVGLILLVAFLGIALPLWILQIGIMKSNPVISALMLTLGPVVSYAFQGFDDRLSFSLYTALGCILIIVSTAYGILMDVRDNSPKNNLNKLNHSEPLFKFSPWEIRTGGISNGRLKNMKIIDVSKHADFLKELVQDLHDYYETVESEEFLQRVPILAHELPIELREELIDFKLNERGGVCVVRGFEIDDAYIGSTPTHWRNEAETAKAKLYNFYLVLVSHVLGETVAWATEQGGNHVHEVFPIKGNAGGQLGTSTDQLYWHTEDAFHPERMDYVALLCLRNHDQVATTYADVDDLNLSDEIKTQLFREAYPFLPDEGNRADRTLSPGETGLRASIIRKSHAQVLDMFEHPKRVSALFGSPESPYIRVHPHYIGDFSDDPQAVEAFDVLKGEINKNLKDVVLQAGDILFIDNFKSVHGRREIPGKFDGTDRWLKRAFIVRDLRKTRHLRTGSHDRIVY